jgi:hypothetical protein
VLCPLNFVTTNFYQCTDFKFINLFINVVKVSYSRDFIISATYKYIGKEQRLPKTKP